MKRFLAMNAALSLCAGVIESGMNKAALVAVPFVVCALLRRVYEKPLIGTEKMWGFIVAAYACAVVVGIRMAETPNWLPVFMVYFASGILVARSALTLTDRTIAQLVFLSVSIILINCILTNHLLFGILLVPYVFSLMAALIMFEFQKSARPAQSVGRPLGIERGHTPSLGRAIKWMCLAILVACGVFIVFPRPFVFLPGLHAGIAPAFGMGDLARRIGYRDPTGSVGGRRIAFAVTFDQGAPPPSPYWRGRVMAEFDGANWFTDKKPRDRPIRVRADAGKALSYTVYPYRLQSRVVYTCGAPLLATGMGDKPLLINNLKEVMVDSPFLVASSYKLRTVLAALPADDTPDRVYLDAGAVSAGIARLARDWTHGKETSRDKAAALMTGLRNGFAYRRDVPPPPDAVEPLEHFLFTTRKGNCEYFAGALGAMLRAVGVPCRVVDGFMGMEESLRGETYVVRFSQAHAWVEAALGDGKWTLLDPTPAVSRSLGQESLQVLLDLYDEVQYRWITSVVSFDKTDQAAIRMFFNTLFSWTSLSGAVTGLGVHKVAVPLVATLLMLLTVLPLLRAWRTRSSQIEALYVSTMRKVRKECGLNGQSRWHEENRGEIISRLPDVEKPLDIFVAWYLSVRFGHSQGVSRVAALNAGKDLIKAAKTAARNGSAHL